MEHLTNSPGLRLQDGIFPVEPEPGLEVVPVSDLQPVTHDTTQEERIAPTPTTSPAPASTFCGLQQKTFWVVLTVVLVIIAAAAIGGGVGTSLRKVSVPTDTQHAPAEASASPLTPALPLGIRKETALASISWGQGVSLKIRIYYQNHDGYIQESVYVDGKWEDTPTLLAKAKSGTPLAASFWPLDRQDMITPYQVLYSLQRSRKYMLISVPGCGILSGRKQHNSGISFR
jgi:hypothetical protein